MVRGRKQVRRTWLLHQLAVEHEVLPDALDGVDLGDRRVVLAALLQQRDRQRAPWVNTIGPTHGLYLRRDDRRFALAGAGGGVEPIPARPRVGFRGLAG